MSFFGSGKSVAVLHLISSFKKFKLVNLCPCEFMPLKSNNCYCLGVLGDRGTKCVCSYISGSQYKSLKKKIQGRICSVDFWSDTYCSGKP